MIEKHNLIRECEGNESGDWFCNQGERLRMGEQMLGEFLKPKGVKKTDNNRIWARVIS